MSPWGTIDTRLPSFRKTHLQPTLELTSDAFGGLSFSRRELGFEPGPIAFGRALRPTLFDCVYRHQAFELQQISSNSEKRWKEIFSTLAKSAPQLQGLTEEKILKELFDYIILSLLQELPTNKEVLITGFFAPLFFPALKSAVQKSGLKMNLNAQAQLPTAELKKAWDRQTQKQSMGQNKC